MTDNNKIPDLIEQAEDRLFQQIADRQEGAIGLEESKRPGPEPSPSELARWSRELDKLTIPKKRQISWKQVGVAAAVIGLSLMLTVTALQVQILNAVETIQEKFTQLSPNGTPADTVAEWDSVYLPTDVPKDFMMTDAVENADSRVVEYTNSEGARFSLYQYGGDTVLQLDTEDAEVTDVHLGENTGRQVHKGTWAAIYWHNFMASFCIEYDFNKINDQVIQQVAQSVALQNKGEN